MEEMGASPRRPRIGFWKSLEERRRKSRTTGNGHTRAANALANDMLGIHESPLEADESGDDSFDGPGALPDRRHHIFYDDRLPLTVIA